MSCLNFSAWVNEFADTFYKCFIREDRYKLLLSGVGVTIQVSLLAVLLGIAIGMLVALCNLSNKRRLGLSAAFIRTLSGARPR